MAPPRPRDDDLNIPEDPVEAAAWLEENLDSLSDEQLQEAQAYFEDQALTQGTNDMYVGQAWGELASAASTQRVEGGSTGSEVLGTATDTGSVETVDTEQEGEARDREREQWNQSLESAADTGAEIILDSAAQHGVLGEGDLANAVSAAMPSGLSDVDEERWRREAMAAAREQAASTVDAQDEANNRPASGEEVVNQTLSMSATPRWMLEAANQVGYTFNANDNYGLPPELQQRFLEYYNDLYGTSYSDFDMLAATMEQPSDEAASVWEAALLGDEPSTSRSVSLPGMEPVVLSQEEVDILRGTYGLSNDGVTRLVRMAYLNRGLDPTTGEQRPIDLYALAAAVRGMNMGQGLQDREQRDQEIAQLEQQIEDVRNSDWGPDASGKAGAIARLEKQLFGLRRMNTETSGGGPNAPGVYGVRNQLFQGLERYNQNQTLAVLHVMDPGLASRIAKTGGDPEKLDPRDNARAYDLLIDAGVVERQSTNGFRPDSVVFTDGMRSYFGIGAGSGGSGGGGGGGSIRRMLDPAAVKEQSKSFFQAVLRGEAPDSLVNEFAKALQGQLDRSPEGQDFDATARIHEWVKSQPRYGELYGKKPGGIADEEWQGQFIGAQQSILGNELPSAGDPVALGMESGQYQTAVGSAIGTKEAWGNSTWLERLANAAQTVAQNT